MNLSAAIDFDAAVPEQVLHRGEVEQGWCIARDEGILWMPARWAESGAALTDRKTPSISGRKRRKMTRHAGDVSIAAQDLVESK
jgi:hypothetical protein